MVGVTNSAPAVTNPHLSITINRDDGGVKSGFDASVSKATQNLQVSGYPADATYYQKAFPHSPPFLAFKTGYN